MKNKRPFEFKDRSGKIHKFAGGAPSPKPSRKHEKRPEQRPEKRPEQRSDRRPERHPEKRHGRRPERGGGAAMTLKATVDKNHKGFAFLIFEQRTYEDAFVSPRDAESFFHGDRVEVTVNASGEIFNIRVLQHRFRELVGRYNPHPIEHSRGGWVIYERKKAREEVYAPQGGGTAKAGDWVKAKLHFHEKGPLPVTAEVIEVYGESLPASADIGMVASEYNLIEEHSQASIREAESKRLEVPGRDLEGREDLRKVPFITIDGETARDFDDAVFVERRKSGFILWVAIADVSHYVTDGSALDQEARSRGTSVYFPEKAFHMLPRALSENLCSLRPDEPRLSMVAKMEYDARGKRTHTEVMEAVIQSKRRATYNQIQAEWVESEGSPDWLYAPHFELFAQIRKQRLERGSIDFDLPEAELKVSPDGEVISITNRARLESHRLIEEFMIAANEAVTEWMMERTWPFVYRIHDEPALDSLQRFQELAATVGVRFSIEKSTSPKVMADLVRTLEGHPAQALLNTALLRSMKQAIYSSTHGIHYGLASEAYTHFTSPIRRYPDLVVHRMIREALRVEKRLARMPQGKDRDRLETSLAEICEHCSYRERLASDAERESIKLKQVRAMLPKLGEEFDGKIVGMIEPGMFASIQEPFVEGFISREAMMDDFYQFNEERMIFYGRRKKRTFKIGDPVRIRLLKADIDKRTIDFGLLDGEAPLERAEAPAERLWARKPVRTEGGRGDRDRGPHGGRGGKRGGRGGKGGKGKGGGGRQKRPR